MEAEAVMALPPAPALGAAARGDVAHLVDELRVRRERELLDQVRLRLKAREILEVAVCNMLISPAIERVDQ